MLETTYTLSLGQLLKIAPNLKKYMWQKLKQKKPNIITKVILEPIVAIVVDTHSKVDIVATKVDDQMSVIQMEVGKNIVEDVLINGGASVNNIIETSK